MLLKLFFAQSNELAEKSIQKVENLFCLYYTVGQQVNSL